MLTVSSPPATRRAVERLCRACRVRALYSFGSRERQAWRLLAGGRARGASDLDLAVRWLPSDDEDLFKRRGRLEDGLWKRLRGVQLDLVEIDDAGTFLAAAALRGERLYAADDREADAHEELVWAMAADLAPIERWRQGEEIRLVFEAAARAEAARVRD